MGHSYLSSDMEIPYARLCRSQVTSLHLAYLHEMYRLRHQLFYNSQRTTSPLHMSQHTCTMKTAVISISSVDLKEEREEAGPSIDECPILQEIFIKMEATGEQYSDDNYSSESDIRRTQKPKSYLVEAGSTDKEMIEMFGSRRET
jgi:hypothetical protein